MKCKNGKCAKGCFCASAFFTQRPAEPKACCTGANCTKRVGIFNTGVTPAGLAITPNGTKGYVANNANYGDYTLPTPPQDINTVTVFTPNGKFSQPTKTISDASFNGAYTITINATGTMAFVTNSGDSTVTIIDIATDTVIGVITGFDGPSGFVILPDGTRAYVNNYGATPGVGSGNGTTVNVVDMTQFPPVIIGGTITVGQAPAAITVTPSGDFVYTANYEDGNPNTGTLSKISTATNTATTIGPFTPGFGGPFSIKITPNGKTAVVTNFGSNNFVPFGTTVSLVDLASETIVKTINGGIQPSGLDITKDGAFAYFSNYNTLYSSVGITGSVLTFNDLTAGAGTVNIIDLETMAIVGPTVSVDQSPANIAIYGDFAYVTNYTSNTVAVLEL